MPNHFLFLHLQPRRVASPRESVGPAVRRGTAFVQGAIAKPPSTGHQDTALILKAGKPQIEVPAEPGSDAGRFPVHGGLFSCALPRRKGKDALRSLSHQSTTPFTKVLF